MRIVRLTRQSAALAAAGGVVAMGFLGPAVASTTDGRPLGTHQGVRAPAVAAHAQERPQLPSGEHYVCPAPARAGQMACMSIIRTAAALGVNAPSPSFTNGSYGPSALRSAYKLTKASKTGGRGRLVAIVDAFNDPNAARDLARYRAHYHLPPCSTTSGCLKIVNEHGQKGPLPGAKANWAVEESLDLDMVSAICPHCHILLVEATRPSTVDLGTAVDTAVAMDAKYVSNSWSGGEFVGQDFFDHFFNHPGVVVDFASGDLGYGPQYPTDLQFVTAVGGTSLRHASGAWLDRVRLGPE